MKNSGKKLSLKKEKIASLSEQDMSNVKGGGKTCRSTRKGFTCCMCTNIDGDDIIKTIEITTKL